MPKKKKLLTPEERFAIRSAAAKKGHVTRKARKNVKAVERVKRVRKTTKEILGKKTLEDRTIPQLEQDLAIVKRSQDKARIIEVSDVLLKKLLVEQEKNQKIIDDNLRFADHVPAETADRLHGKAGRKKFGERWAGTVAQTVSGLRHIPEAETLWETLERFRKGPPNQLRELAEYIAEDQGVDVREVYNFLYSP